MKEGEIIFESNVFSHVLNQNIAPQVCDYCLDTLNITDHNGLNRCSKCQVVYYCNKRCQKVAWGTHKVECNFISSVKPHVPPPTGRFVIRTLIKLKQGGDKEYEVLPDNTHRMFNTLMTHEEDIKKDPVRMEAFAYYFKMVQMCFGEFSYKADFVFKVFCRLMINSVEINDHLFRSIGTGLYLNLSAIDHDCRPNANVIFLGRKARICALEAVPEPIMKNLRISYNCDDLNTSNERHESFRKQYYFTCTCSLCTSKEEIQPSLPCSKCKLPVNANADLNSSGLCSICNQPIETVRLYRYTKWHLRVDKIKDNINKGQAMDIDVLKDAFAIYREGLAMEVKNDFYLYLSAYFVFRSLLAVEEPPQVIKSTFEMAEVEDICKKQLEHQKKLYHDNSLHIGLLYMEIVTVIRMFKSRSSEFNVKKLLKESLRIHELFYTKDSDLYKRLATNILIQS